MKNKELLVSVHDISPFHEKELSIIFRELDRISPNKVGLYTIIDWEGHSDLSKDKKLITLLKNKEKKGNYLGLHGLTHYSDKIRWRELILFGEKDGKMGEFTGLSYPKLLERIKSANSAYKKIFGKSAKFFIPPRWETTSYLLTSLKESNIEYTETAFGMINLKTGKKRFSLVCCFDYGGNRFLNKLSRPYSKLVIFLSGLLNLPLRYSIHPNDVINGNLEFEMKLLQKLIKQGWVPVNTEDIWTRNGK